MNCGIAVFPSKDVQDFVNNYRKRYDPHYKLIKPHMTIREAEDLTQPQIDEAVAYLERVAAGIAPFKVRFNRFSSFFPVNHVIYLALEDKEPLMKLYSAVCNGPLAEPNKPYVYNPHVTIGQQLSSDELHDVLASLKQTQVDITNTIDRFELLKQSDDGIWKSYRTFQLQG
jgi:2'-5' RNA ligase